MSAPGRLQPVTTPEFSQFERPLSTKAVTRVTLQRWFVPDTFNCDKTPGRSVKRPASPCGGGKSLGCSVPILVSLTSDVYEHYRRYFYDACAQHDYCYRHGYRTYGLDREACDAEFLDNMLKACPAPSRFGIGEILDALSVESRNTCLATAAEFHAVVRRYGEDEFQHDTSTTCHYNGPP